jgi:hypothetical protein
MEICKKARLSNHLAAILKQTTLSPMPKNWGIMVDLLKAHEKDILGLHSVSGKGYNRCTHNSK